MVEQMLGDNSPSFASRVLALAAVLENDGATILDGVAQRGSIKRSERESAVTDEAAPDWELVGDGLAGIAQALRRHDDPAEVWLTIAALSTVFASPEQVGEFRRRLARFATDDQAAVWLMRECTSLAHREGFPAAKVEILTDRVVVDVDFTAQHDLNTGVQRVVRSLMPRWESRHDLVPIAWTLTGSSMRTLTAQETDRVLRWSPLTAQRRPGAVVAPNEANWSVVVPWRTTVVLSEVPGPHALERLREMAQWSGNRIGAVGYDCIPVLSGDMMPVAEPNKFVKYLSLVKHVSAVSGISESAAEEFRGFTGALPAQGLVGPKVSTCMLPTEYGGAKRRTPDERTTAPLVLCVGSAEPRKNHLSILYAAEQLWREGNEFQLRFVSGGGGQLRPEVRRMMRRLHAAKRDVEYLRSVDDATLDSLYGEARFSVFPSLHEGFGLPVVESFAFGVPVVTSELGSMREIAADGGALLVDPRDEQQLTDAMRRLLLDDALLATLRTQIEQLPSRTWDDYATELWGKLVEEG